MRRGFSLVELSIVLVILGLLVGGVLSGQSLIRASELRSVISSYQKYVAAANTFRDKYFALPGDMTNAQSFWGVRAAGTNLACQQTINVTTGTCNSDGDGHIGGISGDAGLNERFLMWQHLAYAGLIEGSYTGASANATTQTFVLSGIGTNTPPSKMSPGFFYPAWVGAISGDTNWYDGSYGFNALAFWGNGTLPLLPSEAWNIDTKLDDGMPATGGVFANKMSSTWMPGCTTTDTAVAQYNLTGTTKVCGLWMKFI